MIGRRWKYRLLDATLGSGAVARLSYRLGLHGTLRVTTHEIVLPAGATLPAPLTLAFASDFHAGPTTHPAMFELYAQHLVEQAPDVLLLGGDYISTRASQLSAVLPWLTHWRAPLGIYAVLGNHDLWARSRSVAQQLEAAGIPVLVNRHVPLPAPFSSVSICGIDDPWVGRPDLSAAFQGAGPIRIFLTHSPDAVALLTDEHFAVAFAGHTHGGQVALPGGTPIVTAGGRLARAYSRGRFELAGHGPLIVSRGIGCSNLPLRLNADPELVLCRLRPRGGP